MKITAICAAFLVAATVSARDITTLDGKTYKNVQICSVTPVGFDISYTPEGGGLGIKELFFKDLPEDIRKEFKYNPQKAEAFSKRVSLITQKREEELEKEYKEKQEEEARAAALHDKYQAKAYAGKIHVVLKGIRSSSQGFEAWATLPDESVTTGNLGKVFVIGLDTVPAGGEWAGYIYPTGTMANGLQCYTVTLEQAVIIIGENAAKAKKPKVN